MNAEGQSSPLVERGFWVGEWLIEPMGNRATLKGSDTQKDTIEQLEPKVMQVLVCMAERPNRTVTKDAFMSRVWSDTVVSDDVLARCISELRKLFGDDSRDPHYIETIRKTGYRLIAPVRVREPEPHLVPVHTPGASSQSRNGVSGHSSGVPIPVLVRLMIRRRPFTVAGIAAGIATLIVLGFALGRRGESTEIPIQPPRVLTFTSFPGEEKDPALSPNGDFVVFAWNGGEERYDNIYLKQPRNETPLRITNAEAQDSSPTWSPTGDRIAFIRATDDGQYSIYTAPTIGGGENLLLDLGTRRAHSLAWSPDTSMSRLAISIQKAAHGPYNIHFYSLDLDTLIDATTPPPYSVGDLNPVFSPDANRLAFARTIVPEIQDVFVMRVGDETGEGSLSSQLTSDSTRLTGMDWSTDGSNLIIASERGGASGLWRVPATGGEPEWITGAAEGNTIYSPTLALNGERLAYVEESANVNIWSTYRLRNVPEPLITSTRWDSHPDITDDGARLAFVSRRSGNLEIWMGDSDGSNLAQVTESGGPRVSTPRWSPDGQSLAFVAWEGGSADIWVIGASGIGRRQITDDPAEDTMPSWSRDGSAIYFASNRTEETWQIYKFDLETRVTTQITQLGGYAAQEGPRGEMLYLMRPDTSGIWMQPMPEEPEVDTTGTSEEGVSVVAASLFGRFLQDSSAAIADTSIADTTVQIVPPELLIANVAPEDRGNWLVTEQGIYFILRDGDQSILFLYRFGTGRTARIRTLENLPEDHGLTLDASGGRIVYTRVDSRESDIFYIDRFR